MISPLAGKPAPSNRLVNVSKLVTAYYTELPDPSIPEQRVLFGTSGHRGSSFTKTFNEQHILAMTQAICMYRASHKIDGPLFLGVDTHALSAPAFASAMEVLAANGINVMISKDEEYTPTPVVSHAILTYNQNRDSGLADGIIITPSHNPPHHGGFKYNPPTGGPANLAVTSWIEKKANEFLENKLHGIKRIFFGNALRASTTHYHDYLNHYVNDLGNVLNMEIIRHSNIHLGVDPLGGAGIHYWEPIAERYGLNLTVINKTIDPTFSFMTVDWDGQIRMDPSSPYAMTKLINEKNQFDIAFACDTDHDRHGIVTKKSGLLPPNHFLSAAVFYLFQHRPLWDKSKAVGKTIVTSQMMNRISAKLSRKIVEVPVGFKWFVPGLVDGSLGFCGEESSGVSFCRLDGNVWTSDKDGMIAALLAAEMTASLRRDIGDIYHELENEFGKMFYKKIKTKATWKQKEILKKLSAQQVTDTLLAGETIENIETSASGNNAPLDGIKVSIKNGWFVARPSGTELIYEIYAESFRDISHLNLILQEAQKFVDAVLQYQSL